VDAVPEVKSLDLSTQDTIETRDGPESGSAWRWIYSVIIRIASSSASTWCSTGAELPFIRMWMALRRAGVGRDELLARQYTRSARVVVERARGRGRWDREDDRAAAPSVCAAAELLENAGRSGGFRSVLLMLENETA